MSTTTQYPMINSAGENRNDYSEWEFYFRYDSGDGAGMVNDSKHVNFGDAVGERHFTTAIAGCNRSGG